MSLTGKVHMYRMVQKAIPIIFLNNFNNDPVSIIIKKLFLP